MTEFHDDVRTSRYRLVDREVTRPIEIQLHAHDHAGAVRYLCGRPEGHGLVGCDLDPRPARDVQRHDRLDASPRCRVGRHLDLAVDDLAAVADAIVTGGYFPR